MSKTKKLAFIAVLFLMFFPYLCFAESMNALLPSLINEHERVMAAEDRRDAARHDLRMEWGRWYPHIDLSARGGREAVQLPEDNWTAEWANTQTAKITQLITDFGLTGSAIDRANEILEQTTAGLNGVRQDIMLEGIEAYLTIVKARERLLFYNKYEENLKLQTGMEESLTEKGAGLSSDVLQVRSQLSGAMAMRVHTEGELAIAKIRFKAVYKKALTNNEIESFLIPKAPVKMLPAELDEGVEVALANNPRIITAQYNVKIAKHDLKNRRSAYYPQLNLFGEAKRWYENEGVHGEKQAGIVGLEFKYNLFNGGSDTAAVKAAWSRISEAKNVLTEEKHLVEESVRNAWQQYITYKEEQKLLEDQARIMEEFLELARKERKLGSRTLQDVLNGEISYINAVNLSVSAKIDTILATYRMLHATGQLIMENIDVREPPKSQE